MPDIPEPLVAAGRQLRRRRWSGAVLSDPTLHGMALPQALHVSAKQFGDDRLKKPKQAGRQRPPSPLAETPARRTPVVLVSACCAAPVGTVNGRGAGHGRGRILCMAWSGHAGFRAPPRPSALFDPPNNSTRARMTHLRDTPALDQAPLVRVPPTSRPQRLFSPATPTVAGIRGGGAPRPGPLRAQGTSRRPARDYRRRRRRTDPLRQDLLTAPPARPCPAGLPAL